MNRLVNRRGWFRWLSAAVLAGLPGCGRKNDPKPPREEAEPYPRRYPR